MQRLTRQQLGSIIIDLLADMEIEVRAETAHCCMSSELSRQFVHIPYLLAQLHYRICAHIASILQGRLPAVQIEVATRAEMEEAFFMHLKEAHKGSRLKHGPFYQEALTWLTDGMPAATGLCHRSSLHAYAKCFQQVSLSCSCKVDEV